MDIGLSIATGMRKSGKNGLQVAKELNTSPGYISNVKNGSAISIRQAQKFADVFGVKLSEFIKWGES